MRLWTLCCLLLWFVLLLSSSSFSLSCILGSAYELWEFFSDFIHIRQSHNAQRIRGNRGSRNGTNQAFWCWFPQRGQDHHKEDGDNDDADIAQQAIQAPPSSAAAASAAASAPSATSIFKCISIDGAVSSHVSTVLVVLSVHSIGSHSTLATCDKNQGIGLAAVGSWHEVQRGARS